MSELYLNKLAGELAAHLGISLRRAADQLAFLQQAASGADYALNTWSNKMEELQNNTHYLTNVPKRKHRFHKNAFKRAERNFNGTMKMLKLLAPAGVQCNARAFDIINAKFGL